jgi:hypothetical protein
MEAPFGWRAHVSSLPGAGIRIEISEGDLPATVQSVLDALQTEPRVGSWFGACLKALPWRAFYWECPALATATLGYPFECVALEAPSLMNLTGEPDAFRAYLDEAPPESLVAVFQNLSGDAVLVAPKEGDTGRDIRTSAPSCAVRRKRKLQRSFRPSLHRVSAYAGRGLHASARPATASLGCTAAWTGGRNTIAMRHIARLRAKIRRRAPDYLFSGEKRLNSPA